MKTHGMSGTKTYKSWSYMIARAVTGTMSKPAYYVGKGITVCERWRSFENFLLDMGERPDGTTLDRIDNRKGYEPGNCRWADKTTQAQNKTNTVWLEMNGERHCVAEWSRRTGLHKTTIGFRLRLGWPVEDVLNPSKNFRYIKKHALALRESEAAPA